MKSSVTGNMKDFLKIIEVNGMITDSSAIVGSIESNINAMVNNSQVFLSYTTQKPSKDCAEDVYEIMTVRVIDVGLFEEAIVQSSKGEKIGKEIIEKSLKGLANVTMDYLKKR